MSADEASWLRRFAARGYPAAQPLASGMEGAVYRLDSATVAKVWKQKGRGELLAAREFYAQLAACGLGFETPRILELWEVAGAQVSVEAHLPGVPLDGAFAAGPVPPAEATACLLEVLEGLRAATAVVAARALPVLGEPLPMWEGAESWPDALRRLLDRRLARSGGLLRERVPHFDTLAAALDERLAALAPERLAVLHGDLIPANVLVDADVRPLAVLDFGFLTTLGDPLFDLAVTASVFEMYGPGAREEEARIDRAAAERFELDPERLALYRAAYAIATADAYDPGGEDGHFRWCVDLLGRADVLAAIGVPPAPLRGAG